MGFAEGGRGDQRHLVVDDAGIALLERAGIPWHPLAPPPDAHAEGYHTPSEMADALTELAAAYPERVRLVEIGESNEHETIFAVRISTSDAPAFHWRVLGAHHGDELISAEVALAVAQAAAHPEGPYSPALSVGALWVVPHVNPDGVRAVQRHNAADVDLNRNYGYRWSVDEFHPGPHAFSEPETRSVRALHLRAPPVLGLSLHSGAANLGWVWNHTTDPTPLDTDLRTLALTYADACAADGFWVTNGAAWYPTNGDTNDWSFGRHGTWDYTLELSATKLPDAPTRAALTAAHLPAIESFFLDTTLLTGILTDAQTGAPIRGSIERAGGGPSIVVGDAGRFAVVPSEEDAGQLVAHAPGFTSEPIAYDPGLGVVDTDTDARSPIDLGPILLHRAGPPLDAEVWPPVVVAGSTVNAAWSGIEATLEVRPPGHAYFPVGLGSTSASVSLRGLPPGAWDVRSAGAVARLPWLVDGQDAPSILHVHRRGPDLELELSFGGEGREAWIYEGGQRRSVLPIPHSATTVLVPLGSTGATSRVDVAVYGPGGPTWVADAWGEAWTASSASQGTAGLDTGLHRVWPGDVTACGCSTAPRAPTLLLWVGMLVWTRRRPR